MAFRFQRRIKIAPGVRLNFSKGGISTSLGRRGASVTVGKRGIYGNVGLPGTGMSYRTRLDTPVRKSSRPASQSGLMARFWSWLTGTNDRDNSDWSRKPSRAHAAKQASPSLQATDYLKREARSSEPRPLTAHPVLWDRERGEPLWRDWLALDLEHEGEEDEDGFEERARLLALQRLARRMAEGDRAVWAEILAIELQNEEFPFEFAFDYALETETDTIQLSIELPDKTWAVISFFGEAKQPGVMRLRAAHEDLCCAVLLRVAHEVYRVIPESDQLILVGYRVLPDPATGQLARAIYLKCEPNRADFQHLQLDALDPSSAFEHLGGVSVKKRGELQPIEFDPVATVTG